MARLIVGVIVGVILSFFTVSMFTAGKPFNEMAPLLAYDPVRWFHGILDYNFDYNVIFIFTNISSFSIKTFFAPVFLSWTTLGFIASTIAKGLKRGIMAAYLSAVVVILIWLLAGVLAAVDLMSLFQGAEMLDTVGGMLGSLFGVFLGGLAGGAISGPPDTEV